MLQHIAAAATHVHVCILLSVRVSLRKKRNQERSTKNPSDILRFSCFIKDSLSAHRRYGLNLSLRFFLHSVPQKQNYGGNMYLS